DLSYYSLMWTYAIAVQIGGTPKTDVTVAYSGKVGSTYHVSVNLSVLLENGRTSAIDETIAAQIASSLTVQSSNRNVLDISNVTVTEEGISFDVTATGADGTAEITIDAAGYTGDVQGASVIAQVQDGQITILRTTGSVTGDTLEGPATLSQAESDVSSDPSSADAESEGTSAETESEAQPSEDEAQPSEDEAQASEDGAQTSENGAQTSEDGAQTSEDEAQTAETESAASSSTTVAITDDSANAKVNVESLDDTGQQTEESEDGNDELASDGSEDALVENITSEMEDTQEVNSIRVRKLTIDSDEGGEQDWRETDMAEDAVELGEITQDAPVLETCVLAVIIVLCGGLMHYLYYRKQTRRNVT
ncbi:MAG: hypothetical protein LUB63_06550, partial [Oscillospiraceae bacterium]|nr:hypothetical protein [Oscillospiraceae bacterium]